MLAAVCCHCHGAEEMVRRAFRSGGVTDFLSVPIYLGKENVQRFVDSLPINLQQLPTVQTLLSFVSQSSQFAVVIGYDADRLLWTNVASGRPADVLDGSVIAEAFANETHLW